LPRVGL